MRTCSALLCMVGMLHAGASCPAPAGRIGQACLPLTDGRLLLLGGPGTNAVELYDPADDSLVATGSLGMARWGHTATSLADGRVLVAGGHTFAGPTAALEIYEPATGRFSPLAATLSTPRSGHTATLLSDGRVLLAGGGAATADVFDPATGLVALAPYLRTVSFSDETWYVKTSSGRVGPGPNYFSDSANNVWVDAAGRLHLKILKSGPRWYCSEVVSARSFGFGTYRFYLDSAVDKLDPWVVLGLFTWNDDPAYYNREIDIEFARWGNRNNQNAQYVVQPYTVNIFRFQQAPGASTQEFTWLTDRVDFRSANTGGTIASQGFINGIPQAGGENARMNFWLYQGHAPSSKQSVEVVVSRFEFIPR